MYYSKKQPERQDSQEVHVLGTIEPSSSFFGYAAPWYCFFFFQAEDGIRDADVTGVQTCALPILRLRLSRYSCTAPKIGSVIGRKALSLRGRTRPPSSSPVGWVILARWIGLSAKRPSITCRARMSSMLNTDWVAASRTMLMVCAAWASSSLDTLRASRTTCTELTSTPQMTAVASIQRRIRYPRCCSTSKALGILQFLVLTARVFLRVCHGLSDQDNSMVHIYRNCMEYGRFFRSFVICLVSDCSGLMVFRNTNARAGNPGRAFGASAVYPLMRLVPDQARFSFTKSQFTRFQKPSR